MPATTKAVKILFIDDEASSSGLKRYQARLAASKELDCRLVPPPNLDDLDALLTDPVDLYMIDYELSLRQPDGTKASYQGSTLANEIRARRPELPLVLITRESILQSLNREIRRQLIEIREVCDELIRKDDLDSSLVEITHTLRSLATGFRNLRTAELYDWKELITFMKADREEAKLLREAAPPFVEGERKWTVVAAAHWIRNVVLEYPGILYDAVNAATRLGISVTSFQTPNVQKLFKPAIYAGVFATFERRWWKGRLFGIARDFTNKVGASGPISEAFIEAFKTKHKQQLSPAKCIWDDTPIADWVCYILREPVKIKHSLRYYPDSRPAVMDSARVSFRAVRTSPDFDHNLMDEEGLGLVKEVDRLPDPKSR